MRARLNQSRYVFWQCAWFAAILLWSPLWFCYSQTQPFNISSAFADLPTGTTPEIIIKTYGEPMIKVSIPNSNQEIWSYPNKNVILQYGMIELIDRESEHHFQENSSRLELILAQGFPDSIFYIDGLQQEIWHYETALVIIKNDEVMEWVDHNGKLNLYEPDKSGVKALTIGQSQDEIVNIVGNPSSILQFPALNEEIWHYDRNYLTFKNNKLHSFDQQQKDAVEFRGIFKNDGNPETTHHLLNISSNLGIRASSATIESTTTIQHIKSEFNGIFEHDGIAGTNEDLKKIPQHIKDTSEEWVKKHERVIPQMIINHFFGLEFTSERTNITPASIESSGSIKAITNVQEVFGMNFYR